MKIKVLTQKVDPNEPDYASLGIKAPDDLSNVVQMDAYIRMKEVESIWIINSEDTGLLMNIYFLDSDMQVAAVYDQAFIDRFEELERDETA